MEDSGKRYIGLDDHRHYPIVVGVDAELNIVLPDRRVEFSQERKGSRGDFIFLLPLL